jgi:hypothetical protein
MIGTAPLAQDEIVFPPWLALDANYLTFLKFTQVIHILILITHG